MLVEAIRKATLSSQLTPVLCGSSFKNKGVQPLLDAVIAYLPSPLDVPPMVGLEPVRGGEDVEVIRKASDDEPFSALAFKIAADPYVGKLTYFRVYSGTLEAGSKVLNVTTGRQERIGRILMMHANEREDVQIIYAGDIAAAVGIKQVVTGDTLADPTHPIKLEAITFDEPVISVAIEPKTKSDQEKMSVALGRLAEEDPTFRVSTNEESGQTEIAGMGELHLEVLVDRMMREYKVDANVGRPQVSYRETVRGTATKVEGRHVRQTGGSGQYGIVYIDIEPAPGEGFDFVNKVKGGSIPTEFIPAIEKGVEEALANGVRAGYPVVDVRVTLTDGKYHDTDSSEIAFKIAGSLAFKEAARRAKPVLLEPIFAVEVVTPEEYMGDVIGDLNRRRGRVHDMEPRGNAQVITRARAAERDVRLRDRRALDDPGPRDLHDAVRQVRGGAAQHRREGGGGPHRSAGPSVDAVVCTGSPHNETSRRTGANRKWRRRSSRGTSRTSTSARLVISTMARRR